jgi:hypothetical protein
MIKGWSFAKIITLPIPDANLTDFPVEVPIVADADIGAECLATGYDIRFTAADSITLLPYERESFAVASGEATGIFWVKTDVATAGTYLWLYYGNSAAADGADPENVWDMYFKAVYHMNDVTTSTILDSTANDNDGAKEAANEPIEAAGKIGKGQDFDGGNDVITTTLDPSTELGQEFTIETWLYTEGQANYNGILGGHNTSGILFRYQDGTYNFGYGGNGAGYFEEKSLGALAAATWAHVAVTVLGAAGGAGTGYIKIYKNGAPLASRTTDCTVFHETGFAIGRDHVEDGYNRHFNGLQDEVRASSVARSADWIAYEYANMNPADGGLTWGAEKNVKSAVHSFFES